MISSDSVGVPAAASPDNEVLSIRNPMMANNTDQVNDDIKSIKLDLHNLMLLLTASNKSSTKEKFFNLMVKLDFLYKFANDRQKKEIHNLMTEIQICHKQVGVPDCSSDPNIEVVNLENTLSVESLDQSGDADSEDIVKMTSTNVPATSSNQQPDYLPNGPDSVLHLFVKDSEGHFHLDREALNRVMSKLKDFNLVILLVTGAFPRGKSLLLNCFLRYLYAEGAKDWISSDHGFSGFPCEIDSSEQDTNGISMWSKPFLINDDTAVLLMNTQGSFNKEENDFLFSLSTMVSSIMICNLHERNQMEDSQNLKFLRDFGQLIQHDCNHKVFQTLLLVVRDWALFADTPNDGYLGGEELLEELFQGRAGQGMSEMIQTCFEDTKCCVLPHPSEARLNNRQFSGALSELSPVFSLKIQSFIERVLDPRELITKKLGNIYITGAEFTHYFSMYVEHLQSENRLNPEALFYEVSHTCKELARKQILSWYGHQMEQQLKSTEDFVALHQSVHKEALEQLKSLKFIGGDMDADTERELLSQEIDEHFDVIRKLVEEDRRVKDADVERTKQKIKEYYRKTMDFFCADKRSDDILQVAHEMASSQALEHLELINDQTTAFNKHVECAQQIINKRWCLYKNRNEVLSKLNDDQASKNMSLLLQDALISYKSAMLDFCHANISTKEFDCHHLQVSETYILSFQQKAKFHIGLDRVKDFLDQLKMEMKVLFEDLEEIHAKRISEAREQKNKRPCRVNYAIGIDLGTTHCCVAVFKDNKVEVIRNNLGRTVTPSAVFFGATKQIFGYPAIHKGFDHPMNCITEVKRIIGRKFNDPVIQNLKPRFCFNMKQDENGWPFVSVENGEKKEWTPEEISSLLLGELRNQASIHLDAEVFDAVVTIPCFFNELQREATKKACTLAGLNLLRIINEPTAAAIAYGVQKPSENARNVVVFDFGGGTCDVSILHFDKENYSVLASYGDNELGGEDFDDILYDHLLKEFEKNYPDVHFKANDKRRLRSQCEVAKRDLTDHESTLVYVLKVAESSVSLERRVTREEYRSLTAHLFPLILKPVNYCLKEAHLEPDEIEEVILVGGSSHFTDVQILLREKFPDARVHMDINPDDAIAYGAAIQAAISSGQYHEKPPVVKDICPFSLGIEENSEFFEILIQKNTPLPATCTKEFCTTTNNQSVAQFVIYQGENQIAKQNTLLGSFELTNIKRARAEKTKFDVTFTIDNDGILAVTAKEIGTDNCKEIIINRSA